MRLVAIPEATMVITFPTAPRAEENLHRGVLINEGDWLTTLFHGPLAIGLAVGVVVPSYLSTRVRIIERMREVSGEAGDE